MENLDKTNKKNNESIKQNKQTEKTKQDSNEKSELDMVEKDIEKIGLFIKIVIIAFVAVVIGVFAWIIGKDLLNAINLMDSVGEEIDRDSYTSIMEEVTGKE